MIYGKTKHVELREIDEEEVSTSLLIDQIVTVYLGSTCAYLQVVDTKDHVWRFGR